MRLHITSRDTAIRLKQCTARLELELPAHWHCLPVEEQNRELELAAGRAVADTLRALDIHRALARSA
ncbi:MAG TPA: hypothetical protein VL333_13080 [Candidatus Saccharimonadales bacterium]|jgi:hypothetical protein|nr:hypothetical protein [Candidatus Saccharimonadales bacterium]